MDGEPGSELQVDFGRMGLLHDVTTGRRRVCWALIFTACYSRHMLVWLSFRQTVEDVIEGFEQAWEFFGGVFKVVIPDYVKRHIIGVLCPAGLCGRSGQGPRLRSGEASGAAATGHIKITARRAS